MEIEVRAEQPGDHRDIYAVHVSAFGREEEAKLVELLRDRKKVILSLVAVVEDRVVGHILFSPISISRSPEGFRALALAPLAVLPESQNRGVGSRLALAGLEACRGLKYDAVVVLGHPGYYPRFGFTRASEYGLDSEYNAPDAFMAMELRPDGLGGAAGLVKYAAEFQETVG